MTGSFFFEINFRSKVLSLFMKLVLWNMNSYCYSISIVDADGLVLQNKDINTLRPRQNGRHFPDDIFKYIFLNENVWISLKISLKFIPKVRINNIPPLVQIMAWRRPGDKPLSEPMMGNSLTHICVTRPQWVNSRHNAEHWNMPPEFLIVIGLM